MSILVSHLVYGTYMKNEERKEKTTTKNPVLLEHLITPTLAYC